MQAAAVGSGGKHLGDFTTGTNRYLYSGHGTLPPLTVRTARRSWVVLVASMPVLVAGLAWLYVPLVRRGDVLFVLSLLLLAVALVYPDAVLVLLQAASLGLALALLGTLLQRLVSRRRSRWPSWGGAAPVSEHASSEFSGRVLLAGSVSTTNAALVTGRTTAPESTR